MLHVEMTIIVCPTCRTRWQEWVEAPEPFKGICPTCYPDIGPAGEYWSQRRLIVRPLSK